MTDSLELDDKTLAILITLSELANQGHSVSTIVKEYERAQAAVLQYRQNQG